MIQTPNPFNDQPQGSLNQYEKEHQLAPEKEHHDGFNPYQFNAGNIAAVSGKDYVVIAGDTRLSVGYNILSRNTSKIFKLTDQCVLVCSGMYADFLALQKYLNARIVMYKFDNDKEPSVDSLAQLLATTLYGRRFFPYYCFNLLAGVREDGTGVVYGYDAVGSFENIKYASQGSGKELITPALDILFDGYNQIKKQTISGTEDVAETLADVFTSCAERDIYCGDNLEICIIQKGKFEMRTIPLRKD